MWRLRRSTLRAVLWTAHSILTARKQLRNGVLHPRIAPPPRLPASAARGVAAALRRLPATCLQRALVRQAWNAAWGDRRDVVIGLPAGGLGREPAHAWVDGLDPASADRYIELYRLAP